MPVTFNEKLIAYLALISGLAISGVAVYYSVLGLTAIFAAAIIPIVIMGVILEIGKLVSTLWLKQNWNIAPFSVKVYLMSAILVLMVITSMGIFGFLSKAHLDQSLPSGEVAQQLSLIDEKIKVQRENIDVARKAIKQLDDAVDQTMARSTTEQGASRSAQLRRNQAKERSQLQADITNAQKEITRLNEERAPLQGQLRKVEAEVGPIKYIAQFFYGQADQTVLEKAVTWVIIILIVVFDPLAIILLLASQISFQNFRERKLTQEFGEWTDKDLEEISRDAWVADVGEKPTAEEKAAIEAEGDSPKKESDIVSTATVTVSQEEKDALFAAIQPLFVQNEEQKQSGLWTQTTQPITHEDYMKVSEEKIAEEIDYYVKMIKENNMKIDDVPEPIQPAVRAKV